MRLDTNALLFITKEEIRVLTAIEMGMRNHEFVPVHLIERISRLKRANTYKIIQLVLKNKLVNRESKKYEGYRLTYLGYDYLALYAFMKRGQITKIIGKIGVGKESDIYKCLDAHGEEIVLKFARLGRVSFRAIKDKRDYIQERKNYNWLYLSRLASIKEFTFMELLYKNGFPTPKPIDSNRHGILMSLINGYTLCNVRELENAQEIYQQLMNVLIRFAENGLIHSDFNEFNLMISKIDLKVYVIDFPQMVSTLHLNAQELFDRDLEGLVLWFTKKYGVDPGVLPNLADIEVKKRLDTEVKASGFLNKALDKDLKQLELLDNYNKIVRERGYDKLDGDYNSENDEEMLEGGEDDLEEGNEKEGEYEETKEEEKLESDNENEDDSENENDNDDDDEEEEEREETEEERKEKKKRPKEPKVKKTEKKPEETEEYIDKVLKKKFKPRKTVTKNTNKGRKKIAASDYNF